MRKKEAEHVLQKFVQSKWLIEVLPVASTWELSTLNDGFFFKTIFVSS